MEVGETKTVTVPPEQGYGAREPGFSRSVPLNALPEGIAVGDRVAAKINEQHVGFWVTSIGATEGVIDAKNPLAGRTLVLDLEVMEILDTPHKDHGHSDAGGDHGGGEDQ
jgi:FKBP-type peptidyl-prolyl cis-trans isomerase 2